MRCPYCGSEMEQGRVTTTATDGLYWFPEGEAANPKLNTMKNVTAKGGIVLDGPYLLGWELASVSACCCRACKKIVIDYGIMDAST